MNSNRIAFSIAFLVVFFGISHLADWSNFDKTVCGVALKDENGNILFGKEPSVAECESYDGSQLIYTRREE